MEDALVISGDTPEQVEEMLADLQARGLDTVCRLIAFREAGGSDALREPLPAEVHAEHWLVLAAGAWSSTAPTRHRRRRFAASGSRPPPRRGDRRRL